MHGSGEAFEANLGAEHGVVVVVAEVGARHIAELDHVGAGDERGGCPLGELVGVVLQLCCQHRSALVLQLLPPVHTCASTSAAHLMEVKSHKLPPMSLHAFPAEQARCIIEQLF